MTNGESIGSAEGARITQRSELTYENISARMAVIRRHSVMRDRLALPQDSSPTERDSCDPPARVVNGFLMNGAEMLLRPGQIHRR
jgi:hypothetical protein